MEKVNDFVSGLLAARSLSHVAHWATGSYSAHVALGEFYENITELMDAFVEQYQGAYDEKVKPEVVSAKAEDIIDVLDRQMGWLKRNRYEICERDESSLQNTIDEIMRQYETTLYKLRMLK